MLIVQRSWVSVIIPSYNAWIYLAEAIESVKTHLLWAAYEIVVCDDCSDDQWATDAVLDTYSWQKWITVIKSVVRLWAQCMRMKGLEHAVYPYVLMLDADDLLNTSWDVMMQWSYPSRAIQLLRDENIAFVHAQALMFWWFNGYTISPYRLSERFVARKHHVPTFMLYRREEWLQGRIYNEQITKRQDRSAWVWLLNFRLVSGKKNDIQFLNTPYYLYREHDSPFRLSLWNVDEREMVATTIRLYPELFEKYYPGLPVDDIADQVVLYKPTKLEDLLYVASLNSVALASEIVQQRWRYLAGHTIDIADLLSIASLQGVDEAMRLVTDHHLTLCSQQDLGTIP